MKLDFELVKTVLLVLLVSLSLLLTLGIWNYQGDYESSSDNAAADAELNGADETKKNLVQPSQIVIHDNGSLSGFSEKQDEIEVFRDISEWALYNFEMIPEDEDVDIHETAHSIELIFPTSIPSSIISEIFTTDDSMVYDSKFKRVYVFIDENKSSQQIVFENSDQDGFDIRASVQNMSQVVEYFDRLQLTYDFNSYRNVELANDSKVYIPEEANIIGENFRYETINPDNTNFRTIFFPKPSSIAVSRNSEGNQIFRAYQGEVLLNGYAMEYTNFYTSESQQEQNSSFERTGNQGNFLISSSIEYINSHNGWLIGQGIQYRLYNLNEISNKVDYRMIYQNYPVFSKENEGLSSMSVIYKNMTEYQYVRPLMQLTYPYDRGPTDLMSGTELIEYLHTTDRFSFNQITDIQLGYRIQKHAQYIDLIPTWCVETYAGWDYVTGDVNDVTQGGETNAMGSN
ncbi:Two-component signal transduction system YycFG, regulatory protein YycH [Gracilibacillus orientalis]|uniref:Two-component signal transduction system YycFG, regulatory protein YycH n=1 Tax=Gracilibacillus orientalis TaxID=334253 RepID=A0A1I4K690_9BACI|nr:two-component system activity regulator YycH [Gracilibacillus orientalis]SFL74199.1 Two-component signal transduction system YycFG, regulatory protein YycH [Gracilibacillus orientalis]